MSLICLAGMPSEIYIAASCTMCSLAYTAIASLACCAIKELDPLVDMDWYSTLNTLSYSGLDYITIHTPVPKVTREEWLLPHARVTKCVLSSNVLVCQLGLVREAL